MALRFFNTLDRKEEEFHPIEKGTVRMYSCGPTVYNLPHIGNWRSFLFSDLVRRYLEWKGFKTIQVMNLTDVDDKTIAGAKREGKSLKEFTKQYADAFFADAKSLNILPATHYPRATEFIKEMEKMVEELLAKGYAYKAQDGIYYDISKFKHYGRLAKLDLSHLKEGERVANDEYDKQGKHDFALWKAWTEQDGDVFWDGPLGKGRPGWHIECSAMSRKLLGPRFDIHTGGVDLIFPHHENEIAQSEAISGKSFVDYWLHCEHLLVDNHKMAKSLGNFYTLEDVLAKGYSPKSVRYFLLATHYRQQLNFTFDSLAAAQTTVQKLEDFMHRMKARAGPGHATNEILQSIEKAKTEFASKMDDDLNMSEALASLHSFVSEMNTKDLSPADATEVISFMEDLDRILGVLETETHQLPPELFAIVEQRETARKNKDFKESDRLRDVLLNKGWKVEDGKDGPRWKRI